MLVAFYKVTGGAVVAVNFRAFLGCSLSSGVSGGE